MCKPVRKTFYKVEVPHGYCHCGCGKKTALAICDRSDTGARKGKPLAYLPHHHLKNPTQQIIVDNATGCWRWNWSLNNHGYGVVRVGGKRMLAHRVFFEAAKGAIPIGMELDHLCRCPACVNPAHLEPVTHRINLRRGNHRNKYGFTRLVDDKRDTFTRREYPAAPVQQTLGVTP